MTPDEIELLARRLARHADAIRHGLAEIRGRAKGTTWTGPARRRFDHDLGRELKAGGRLVEDVTECAAALRAAARRLEEILNGLRADERDVRTAYPAYLTEQGMEGALVQAAIAQLPQPLDPAWAPSPAASSAEPTPEASYETPRPGRRHGPLPPPHRLRPRPGLRPHRLLTRNKSRHPKDHPRTPGQGGPGERDSGTVSLLFRRPGLRDRWGQRVHYR